MSPKGHPGLTGPRSVGVFHTLDAQLPLVPPRKFGLAAWSDRGRSSRRLGGGVDVAASEGPREPAGGPTPAGPRYPAKTAGVTRRQVVPERRASWLASRSDRQSRASGAGWASPTTPPSLPQVVQGRLSVERLG